jgi:plasmid stabilization system protein ParE
MKVEYSNRAVADLRKISADSRRAFGDRVAEALEARIRAVVEHISRQPWIAPEVEQRPGLHVAPLVRYPVQNFLSRFRRSSANSAHSTHFATAMDRAIDSAQRSSSDDLSHPSTHP